MVANVAFPRDCLYYNTTIVSVNKNNADFSALSCLTTSLRMQLRISQLHSYYITNLQIRFGNKILLISANKAITNFNWC